MGNEFEDPGSNNLSHIIFDDYLAKKLSNEEVILFESKLNTDIDFKNAYTEHVLITNRINKLGYNQLKRKLKNVQNELKLEGYFESLQPLSYKRINPLDNPPRFLNIIALVASILVFVLVISFLFKGQNRYSTHKDMMAKFYKHPIEKIETTITTLETYGFADPSKGRKDSLIMALNFFREYEWEKALPILTELTQNYPNEFQAKFFLGLVYLNSAEYTKSIKILGDLSSNEDYEIKDNSRYYLALSRTISGSDKQATGRILNEIVTDTNSAWVEQAKELQKLNR